MKDINNKKCDDCVKHTYREKDEKSKLINRIKRLEGQMRGVQNMIEEDRYCNDILIQLSAIDKSIKSLSSQILESHLKSCITTQLKSGNEEIMDEVVETLKRFQSM